MLDTSTIPPATASDAPSSPVHRNPILMMTRPATVLASGQPIAWGGLAAALISPAYDLSAAATYLSLLVYLLLGVTVTLTTRSLAAGLGGSLAYYLVDAVLIPGTLGLTRGALEALPGVGPLVQFGSRLLLGYNLSLVHAANGGQLQLTGAAAGLLEPTPFPWLAAGVVVAYVVMLAAAPFISMTASAQQAAELPTIEVTTPSPTLIVVKGIDKQAVGEFAARVRRSRPPEPYKGKGVRYVGEQIIQKAGKSFVGGEG